MRSTTGWRAGRLVKMSIGSDDNDRDNDYVGLIIMDYILTSWVLMAMVRLASPIASEILEVFHFLSNGRVV